MVVVPPKVRPVGMSGMPSPSATQAAFDNALDGLRRRPRAGTPPPEEIAGPFSARRPAAAADPLPTTTKSQSTRTATQPAS